VDPQVIEQTLYYFTEPGELIVDPMAGQGIIAEVCAKFGRRCLMYDLDPIHSKVKKNDIIGGLPHEAQGADHIYLDPPYFNLKVDGAFNNDTREFYDFIRQLAKVSLSTIRAGGHIFFIMCDKTKGDFEPLISRCFCIFDRLGAQSVARVSIPLPPPHNPHTGALIARARETRKLMGRDRTLFVFRRPDA
jgi:DNA modification methylase